MHEGEGQLRHQLPAQRAQEELDLDLVLDEDAQVLLLGRVGDSAGSLKKTDEIAKLGCFSPQVLSDGLTVWMRRGWCPRA